MLRVLSMPNMPYCSMCMPIGWNGQSMCTEGCSMCILIVITNFKVRGVKQDSVPYIVLVADKEWSWEPWTEKTT